MKNKLSIHVICIALNEEVFIEDFIKNLYPFASGISIITQYDRDYYGNSVVPDTMVNKVLSYPDVEGKIHLVMRRFKDEAAARNHEMLSLMIKPSKKIQPHGVAKNIIDDFYRTPDYFLIADADEIFDPLTVPFILNYLSKKRPNGMRVTGYNYMWSWNNRVPITYEHFNHFGFIKPGILFEQKRTVNWNEFRLGKLLNKLHLPDFSSSLYNFINCPIEIGVFHHGAYIGTMERINNKIKKHSHQEIKNSLYLDQLKQIPFDFIPTADLPDMLKNGNWPKGYIA